ncbi:glutathione S-transferase [Coralliovum pocilloporae]|uniref:glutathione S-transferase n=1 Tax=Coralliovum pocilloporae TaxID=3066369 RepID=UPI003306AE0C
MSDQAVSSRPVLYSFRRCPYAMRARLALSVSNQPCELREIVLRDKPPQMLEVSPKGTVPVLCLTDGQVLEQSLDIMLWALGQHDPYGWLRPESGTCEDMLALIAEMDGDFKHHLDHYKYASRYEGADPEDHRERAMTCLSPLVTRLDHHANLFGDRPSLADMALFPFVRQFANTDRVWFEEAGPTALHQWLERHVTSELFLSITPKWAVWDYQSGQPGVQFP